MAVAGQSRRQRLGACQVPSSHAELDGSKCSTRVWGKAGRRYLEGGTHDWGALVTDVIAREYISDLALLVTFKSLVVHSGF